VLVVDDDRLQLRAIQRRARDLDSVELAVADNAIDALLQIGTTRPDVVVMDVFMPGIDGLEACRRITSCTRDTKVILTSGDMTIELERAALAAGAHRVVSKPFDLATLLATPAHEEPVHAATMRGADLIVAMLIEAGVDVVFGLPGGAISPVHDALLDSSIRVVTNRHESGSLFAAAGYAQATGKLGVALVTSGPGALNALTGLASAWCDGLPVLLLVGDVPRGSQGKGVLQDSSAHGLQIVEMARHVTKLATEVPRASALPHVLRRAMATAMSGKRGPVMLTLPLDVTGGQVAPPRSSGEVVLDERMSEATLDELVGLVRGARRPLILAGSGVRGFGAPARLRAVAEALRCPVATTPKAKGVFPESHPLALGVLGLGGHLSARRYLDASPDVVLAIGTSLGDMATDGFSPQLQASRALIHVDIDARQIGKSYAPTHAVVASAAELLAGMAERLPKPASPLPRAIEVQRQSLPRSGVAGRIAPQDAIAEIQRLLPRDTIFTVDSGEHFLFAVQYLEIDEPDAFIVMTGLGSMGQSIGAAIGAQLAHPERTVAAICGDGCFAMNAFEIATAVAEQLPIRVFVFNDGALGMVENGHEKVYGRRPSYPTGPIDICKIARGLGAAVLRVDGVGLLDDARYMLRDTKGPVVIDVRIDRHIVLAKQDRVAAMAPPPTTPTPTPRSNLRLIN
jgi:acetolactate synthase I/II/III large subunit